MNKTNSSLHNGIAWLWKTPAEHLTTQQAQSTFLVSYGSTSSVQSTDSAIAQMNPSAQLQAPNEIPQRQRDLKTMALILAKENPCVATAGITSIVSFVMRYLLAPVHATLDRKCFKHQPFSQAFKGTAQNGLYKGAFVGATNVFVGAGSYMMGVEGCAHILSARYNISHEEAKKNPLTTLAGCVWNAVLTNPLETVRIGIQQKSMSQFTAKHLMKGVTPAIAVSLGQYGIGFTLGDSINKFVQPVVKCEFKRKLAADTMGLTIGNFLVSPMFNLARIMRASDKSGIINGLKNMGWVHDSATYTKEANTVSHWAARLILGMPTAPKDLEAAVIQPHQKVKLNIYSVMKNYPRGWNGFMAALSIMILSNAIMAGAKIFAEEITKDVAPR
jgi:hypothetical protein